MVGWLALQVSALGASSEIGLPRAAVAARTIWTVNHWQLSDHELATYMSLQGAIARQGGDEQLYLIYAVGKSYEWFLDLLASDYGVTVHRNNPHGDTLRRLSHYAPGYVLYDRDQPDSIQVATMLAAMKGAAIVESQLETYFADLTGWRRLADGGAVPLASFLGNPIPELDRSAPAQHRPDFPFDLRDYLIMAGLPVDYDQPFPAWIVPDPPVAGRPVFGWGNTSGLGESVVITAFSRAGLFNIPSSSSNNLSVLSAFDPDQALAQEGPATPGMEDGKHLVSFLFTDGDNMSFVLKSMASSTRLFGSPLRGQFPVAFGTAPALAELAPVAMQWYYRNATAGPNREHFFAGPSGLGYIFPSRYPAALLDDFTARLARAMGKLDLRYVQIIDFDAFNRTDLWLKYLQHPEISGLVLNDYSLYHRYAGQLSWVNDKPVASARYSLWDGLANSGNDQVAAALNALPRDPTAATGYSIVMVHVWTRGYSDVQAVINQLHPDVMVVSLDVLMETMRARVIR